MLCLTNGTYPLHQSPTSKYGSIMLAHTQDALVHETTSK
jgi:hypothetical protein